MKTLLLLRHAKSSWDDAGMRDHDRPLNKRGKRDAPRIGRLLESENLVPDCIVSSTALRARTTAEIVAESSGYEGDVQLSGELYHAPPTAWLALLTKLPASCQRVLAVGHNPGIEAFLTLLTGEEEPLPTAALAHVRIDIDDWSDFERGCEAQLVEVWRPKELSD